MSNEMMVIDQQVAVREETCSLIDVRMNPQQYPRIGQFTRPQAIYGMGAIVTQAYLLKGMQVDTATIQFIATELADLLRADEEHIGTKYLTFMEIKRAIRKAVLTTEMYGLSVANLYRVIIEYVKGEGHLACKEVEARRDREKREALEASPVGTMLQIFAGEMADKKS